MLASGKRVRPILAFVLPNVHAGIRTTHLPTAIFAPIKALLLIS